MQGPIIYGLMESIDKNWSSEEHPRNRPITLLQFPLFYRTMDFGDLNGGENFFFLLLLTDSNKHAMRTFSGGNGKHTPAFYMSFSFRQ